MNQQNISNVIKKDISNDYKQVILNEELNAKPFLKWAGGKTQLLTHLSKYIPFRYNKYIEPFIGGGAMYFSINADESIISDSNEELIITYKEIKTNVDEVIKHLRTFKPSKDYYYKIRNLVPTSLEPSYRAARLIYLNKTCFNGLYRVNKKGVFNVPYGSGNRNFLNEDVLVTASEYMQ